MDRIGYLDGHPDVRHLAFVDKQGNTLVAVDAHVDRESGERVAVCQNCVWIERGNDRDQVDAAATAHFDEHCAQLGL
ncbi:MULTISPECIES: hypothetical protein [Mycobacteriaceae]|uniref:Transposase n=1 Tax=Mycolicibacterium senegalense TaxID=1796 RepID=A0ABR5FM91_9MYCO|nr:MULTISPECIES: hypothetical protein [Mycolicibacterium]KLI09254.1 hypothetical protein AA982_04085 [Mycolicibacterium senegalense]KLO47646.1 hypothetical protein ABW05_31105 [Mycolicibacterium senegalense]OMB76658.1 hypothetical protein A5741_31790 [Mycolicibacterium conceptionense]